MKGPNYIWKGIRCHTSFQKGDKSDPANYCPYLWWERCLSDSLSGNLYSDYLSTYNIFLHHINMASGHWTEHVLVKTIEDWRMAVDRGEVIAAVFIDFAKAIDSISHNINPSPQDVQDWYTGLCT